MLDEPVGGCARGDVCEQIELDSAFERLSELERAERVQDGARVWL